MNSHTLLLYGIVSFFYIISPGPAVFLAMNNGLTQGTRVVALSSLGNILGLLCLSTISIVGLGSIILASASLFLVVKIIGALYLLYLGVKQFRASRLKNSTLTDNNAPKNNLGYFFEGFILAVTNPKPILFFIAIFPQFLSTDTALVPQFFIMTTLFMFLSFLSLFTYGYIAKSAKRLFSNPHAMQWFHRITGGLFIGLSVGLLQLRNT